MSDAFGCQVCGASLSPAVRDGGGFCNSCGMKYVAGGGPAFTPQDLLEAAGRGDEGYAALAARVGMPVDNIKQVEARFSAYQQHCGQPPPDTVAPTSALPTMIQPPPSRSASTAPPVVSHFGAGDDFTARPRLRFGYDSAFYQNEAGEVVLSLELLEATGEETDIKLTIEGDIARPFNVNMQDTLGHEKKIVVTPTSFPTSRLVMKLSCFDKFEEPHCWVGETSISDVERPVQREGNQQFVISSNFHGATSKQIGDSSTAQNISLSGFETTSTMKRRRLDQPVRCEVFLRPDDEFERQLANTARALRIQAREKFARAQHRAAKGKLEHAYELIREVEELGFMLRETQKLRTEIERGLSDLSFKRGQKLFEQGKLREAYEFLNERKLLVYNPDISRLLFEIDDIAENCTEVAQLIEDGSLDEAEEKLQETLRPCPKYERALVLQERIDAERRAVVDKQAAEKAEVLARAERERLDRERRTAEERLREQCRQLGARLGDAAEAGRWREAFGLLAEYVADERHDAEFVEKTLAAYRTGLSLVKLGKFVQAGEDEPHLLLLSEPELPIGRHESSAIILNDSSRRTGRFHGRVMLNEPGRWIVERCGGEFSKSAHPISLNDEQLSDGEALEIIDDDVISFSGVVKLRARVPEDPPAGAGIELSVDTLLPEDEEYKNMLRWILFDRSGLAGGSNDCHVRLGGVEGEAFVLTLSNGIFWMEPPPNPGPTVTVGDVPLIGPRPLLHQETITVGDRRLSFFQLRTYEELWLWDDELGERGLPI